MERTYLRIPSVLTTSDQVIVSHAPLDALEEAKWTLFENTPMPTAPDAPLDALLDAPLGVTLDTPLVLTRLQPMLDSALDTPLDSPVLHLESQSFVHATADLSALRLLNLRHQW